MSVYAGVIDDNDGTILYSQYWELWQPNNPDPSNYKSTMHSTGVPGSTARVRFTGSRVAVVSTIATGSGDLSKASFSIDNGPAIPVSVVTTPPVQYQYVFWDSGPLSFDSHLLVITNLDKQAYFRIDHIDYDPTDSNAPKATQQQQTLTTAVTVQKTATSVSTVIVGTTAGLGNNGTAVALVTGSNTAGSPTSTNGVSVSVSVETVNVGTGATLTAAAATGTSSASGTGALGDAAAANASSAKKSTPVAGIVGGIVGGVVVILLLGLLFGFLKRRRRDKAIYLAESGSPVSVRNPTIPTPFTRRSHEASASNLVGSRPGTYAQHAVDGRYSTNDASTISDLSTSAMAYGGIAQNYRHQGNSGGTWGNGVNNKFGDGSGAGVRAKHAEYMAEQQHQQQHQQLASVDSMPMIMVDGHGASFRPYPSGLGGSSVGGFPDLDAPPAYSGQVRGVEEEEGGGSSTRWEDHV